MIASEDDARAWIAERHGALWTRPPEGQGARRT